MLEQIDSNLWVAAQALRYLGLSVGTRMTVIRLADGALAVLSPIDAGDGIGEALDRLGQVRHIIAPNLYHYRFAADFKARYPEATLWAAPGLDHKRPELPIDASIPGDAGQLLEGLDYVLFSDFRVLGPGGVDPLNECVFYHRPSRTLIMTDTAFHFDDSSPRLTRWATRLLGGYRRLEPSLLERIASRDKAGVQASMQRVLAWDFDRVIVAHGSIVERRGREKLVEGYNRFLGSAHSVTL